MSSTTTTTHTCVYFDDGDLVHLCSCGSRALYLVEEDPDGGVLVVLLDDDVDGPVAPADASSLCLEDLVPA